VSDDPALREPLVDAVPRREPRHRGRQAHPRGHRRRRIPGRGVHRHGAAARRRHHRRAEALLSFVRRLVGRAGTPGCQIGYILAVINWCFDCKITWWKVRTLLVGVRPRAGLGQRHRAGHVGLHGRGVARRGGGVRHRRGADVLLPRHVRGRQVGHRARARHRRQGRLHLLTIGYVFNPHLTCLM
jgi:hypothetical protein